ncbi:hypothetical protein QA640_38770 [Bradyrhizobium sp. CB82]|uniref:hypothetical protein n=1 Tax=Bradyrhizobium sp. CB82 TaxID=3039159 RepID=UPI0024B2467C|nr:hypothetical protein [Bradyrhizobium sp. CB82]WFU40100.1 hypothetical protein QA640_38770 [Bradyrhizobium sp. CB82]
MLRAGIWLIRNGYGNMAVLPYEAPSGCYWGCEFHPIGALQPLLERISRQILLDHHGGRVRRSISQKGLAQAIMRSDPNDLKAMCAGDVSALGQCWIPVAFHDYAVDYSRWNLVSLHGAPNS